MNSSFNHNHTSGYRRVFLLMTSAALLASVFVGCKKQENVPETTAPTNSLMLDGIQTEPTTLPTEAPPTEPAKPNLVVEGDQVKILDAPVDVRSAASPDGRILSQLEPGSTHDILRTVEFVGDGTHWALVRGGWICLDQSNIPDGPVADLPDPGELDVAPPVAAPDDVKPTTPHRPSMDDLPAENTDKNADKNTNTNTGNTSGSTNNNYNEGNGDKGVVTANGLNVRSEPSTKGDVKDTLPKGTRITILEKKDGWGRTNNGWVSLNYVYMDGATGTNTAKGVVVANGLNVRTGPGTDNKSTTSYNYGTRVNILEQVKVGNTTWGATKDGWISLDYVYIDGTKGDNGGEGRITGDGLNIRSGPGTDYKAVGSLNSGDTVTILTQIKVGNTTWGCIDKGWVSMDYVDIR